MNSKPSFMNQIATVFAIISLVFPQALLSNPLGESVVAGQASFDRNGNTLDVNQSSDRTIINWQDFSIANGEITNFNMPSSTSAALNRVTGGNLSEILGTLNSNGNVFLINPNGVVVGGTGVINTQGFIASTLDLSNSDFMAGGDLSFLGASDAAIINLGNINSNGGSIFLIAKRIENSGNLKADGQIGLAAGSEVLLKNEGDQRISIVAGSGSIDNKGAIEAAKVELKAAGNNPYALAINNEGLIRATGVTVEDGKVILDGGEGLVRNSGKIEGKNIDVRSENIELTASSEINADGGGQILVIADNLIEVGGLLSARGGGFIETSGLLISFKEGFEIDTEGGEWLIDPNDFTVASAGGNITGADLAAQLENNNVTIETATQGSPGNGDIFVNDAIGWSSENSLTFNAERDITVNATIANRGSGGLNLNAGNGANGASGATPSARGDGGLRGGDIVVNADITVGGDINIQAGHGGHGGNGASAGAVANASGGSAGNGGRGGSVTLDGQLTAGGSVSVNAGNGGFGGAGGAGSRGAHIIDALGFEVRAGRAGGGGGFGANGGSVTVNEDVSAGEDASFIAGHGGHGGRAGSAGDTGQSQDGRNGGDGGFGGDVSINADVSTEEGDITARAGNGGNGGTGGQANRAVFKHLVSTSLGDFFTSPNGGDGGDGGNGGDAGSVTITVDLESGGGIALSSGHGGLGGIAGRGADGASNGQFGTGPTRPAGSGGDGGNGGNGGAAGSVVALNLEAQSDITVTSGNGGIAGRGNRAGNGRSFNIGGSGGTGGFGRSGGSISVGDIDTNGRVTLATGHGGHGGDGGVGGDGGSSFVSTEPGGRGGRGGSGGFGGNGGALTFSDIDADGVNISTGFAGVGRAGAPGGLSQLVNFGTERAESGFSGAFGNNVDIEIEGSITTADQDIVLSASRDLILANGASLNATGAGNIIGNAASNFHNDSGNTNPISVNTGRFLIYSARPDQNRNDLEMDRDFVRYGTSFNGVNPNPAFFPEGNGLIFRATVTADATVADQTITYGESASTSGVTLSNFQIDGSATTAAALGIDPNNALEVQVGRVSTSNAGFATAGTHNGALGVNNLANLILTTTNGDLTVNKRNIGFTAEGVDRVYDGTTNANVNIIGDNRLAGDVINIAVDSANFADKNVGDDKQIRAAFSFSGDDVDNYNIFGPRSISADITPASLTVRANNTARTFDGSAFSGGAGARVIGLVDGDTVSDLSGRLIFGGDSQGAVNPGEYEISVSGVRSQNYNIEFESGNLAILPEALDGDGAFVSNFREFQAQNTQPRKRQARSENRQRRNYSFVANRPNFSNGLTSKPAGQSLGGFSSSMEIGSGIPEN